MASPESWREKAANIEQARIELELDRQDTERQLRAVTKGAGTVEQKRIRLEALEVRVKRHNTRLAQLNADQKEVDAQLEIHSHATQLRNGGSALPEGTNLMNTTTQGGIRSNAPSPLHMSETDLRGMYEAARHGQRYRVEIGQGRNANEITALTKSFREGAATKAGPIATGGGMIPPILLPQLTEGLLAEPDRLFTHFPTADMPGPTIEYLRHTGNTAPAAAVAELGTKPDIGMQLSNQSISATKIAALATISTESLQDFGSFLQFVPSELTRAVIDAETDMLCNGTGTAPEPLGLVNQPGTLTRVHPSSGEAYLDTMQEAYNDLRIGSAYATPDLVLMHPTTWSLLRRQKDTMGRYLLAPDPATGQVDTLWGAKVIVNTWVPLGTALVFDTGKAAMGFIRQGLIIEASESAGNGWAENYTTFRAEQRLALAVMRPTAINIVTGLT